MNDASAKAAEIVKEMVKGYGEKFPGLEVLFQMEPTLNHQLHASEPIPALGRYRKNVSFLEDVTSGRVIGLTRFRVAREYVKALNEFMSNYEGYAEHEKIISDLSDEDMQAIMMLSMTGIEVYQAEQIESVTEHDTAAATDFLKLQIATKLPHLAEYIEAVHFACTSEDNMGNVFGLIGNRLVYGYFLESLINYCMNLISYAKKHSQEQLVPLYLPALTHQQAAEPTTLDIIVANIVEAILELLSNLIEGTEVKLPFSGKMGGATGTLICHYAAYPDGAWHEFARDFVEGLELYYTHRTNQCVSYAREAQIFTTIANILTIIDKGESDFLSHASCPAQFFMKQKKKGTKGSSIMPNKSNGWLKEGARTMLKEARVGLLSQAERLPSYPHQGDMARSYSLRNLGTVFMPIFIALDRMASELNSYVPNRAKIDAFFDEYPGMSGAALQTVMKRMKIPGDAYREIQEISINSDGSYANQQQFRTGLEEKMKKFGLNEEQRLELLSLLDRGRLLKEAQAAAVDDLSCFESMLGAYKEIAEYYKKPTY